MSLANLSAQRWKRFRFFSPFIFFFLTIFFLFLGKGVAAQIPPQPVDCDGKPIDPEFHSLRPYQASPCKKEPSQTARFCGNRLVLTDKVSDSRSIPPRSDPECARVGSNTYRCSYKVFRKTASYSIDLSNASLPILGNTEKVINSQNQNEELDDAEKTNEYVSWYLNGVTGRAEYGADEDIDNTVNFAGPVKKLLPQVIQHKAQIATIERRGEERHDQIVVCGQYNTGIIGDLLNIGSLTPTACYKGDGSRAGGDEVLRLSSWDDELSAWNDFMNDIVGNLVKLLPEVPEEIITNSVLRHWNSRKPPLPWGNDPWEDRPMTSLEYRKYYNEWRGKTCVTVPLLNWLVCLDNFLVPNRWADLFPYVPLSSTEDRVGLVSVDSQNVSPASPDLTISNVSLTTAPAKLYFAHTEEVAELASLLQLTFVPQGNPLSGGASSVTATEACDLTNIRSNAGDDLFATKIEGALSYDAEFTCDFPASASSSACTKDLSVGLNVITETPKADEVWERLVAGPSAIFKRIFPKVGIGGAILGILDMPAATKVSYSGSGVSAGNPGARSGESAELYFPHIGGVSEYFLKGIQTILRPKGFGEQIISGAEGTIAASGEINCDQNAPAVSLARTIARAPYFQLALNWASGQAGNHALECYNDTVRRAMGAGINVPLTLWIWLHESGASNYALGWTKDFGADYPAPQGYVDQINEYFRRARVYNSQNSLCAGRNVTDLEAFAYIYKSGTCDPDTEVGNETAGEYYNNLVAQWSWITGCPLPRSTTDTSCQ